MKMNLRQAEASLEKEIEELGMRRVIFHSPGISYAMATTVYLVPKEQDMRKDVLEMDTRALGIARCHLNDQFNRRKGRVLATARALVCLSNGWRSCSGKTYVDKEGVEHEVPKHDELS